MHIVFFAPAWPLEAHPNGVVTYVHWMRKELQRQGHRVTVLTGRLQSEEDGACEVRNTRLFRAKRWLLERCGVGVGPVFAWGELLAREIHRIHEQTPIDVFEIEESFGWAAAVVREVPVPVVVKLHGPAFLSLVEEELETESGHLKIEAEGKALLAMQCITSPSQRTLDGTISRYALQPKIARHLVNPLALPDFAPLWSLDTCHRNTVLFVGRFDKRKGGDVVLEAFASLHDKNPALRLIFVGPDPGLPARDGRMIFVKDMIESLPAAAAAQVEYLGIQSPTDIYRIRTRALVTIVASRWENHSYTALEAMLQGCPLVSSDVGGQAEFVRHGETGLLATAGDPSDMAAKIQSLVDDPERAAILGRAARRHVMEHHGPAEVVRQTLVVYREAIETASRVES